MPDLSKIEDMLKEIKFPVEKEALIQKAKEKGVPDFIISKIQDVDVDKFEDAQQLKSKIGLLGKMDDMKDKLGGLKNIF